MEFLQGIYRGRGGGKGNALEREIELIVPQVLVAPPSNTQVWQEKQRVNLLATLMLLRMSILTRIFGAANLFGKSVACIPTAGTLVEGAARTTMDEVHEAKEELERNLRYNPQDTKLRAIVKELPNVFDNERAVLYHNMGKAKTLVAEDYRQRLSQTFLHDANQGLDVIAQGDYLPENCYTVGELILQRLDKFSDGTLKEKNKHWVETHLPDIYERIETLRNGLWHLSKNTNMDKQTRDAATTLYGIMSVLAEEADIDTESETRGSTLNRWLVYPLSSLSLASFWSDTADKDFKQDTQDVLKACFNAYVCRPNYTLPILSAYGEKALPWLLVRGPEIEQRLAAQYQTRYLISSSALALLNVLLLAGQDEE